MKLIDTCIRDMTSVVPRPKSEVRARLNEIIQFVIEDIKLEEMQPKKVHDPILSDDEIGAYNAAVGDVNDLRKHLRSKWLS